MSDIPKWHYAMLNDDVRNDAFSSAIAHKVRPGDRALDIGTGTGVLSLLAVQAGARSVDAFEAHPDMAAIAATTIAANTTSDNIALHRTLSTNVTFLPDDRRDLLITEIFDCALIGEGVLPTLAHARQSLLAENYRSIPEHAVLHGSLISSPHIRSLNEVGKVCGFDVSHLNALQTAGHFPVRLNTWPHTIVSDEQPIYALDLEKGAQQDRQWQIDFVAREDAEVDGVIAWFTMQLGGGQSITTHPAAESHWMQAFIPFSTPLKIAAHTRLTVTFDIEHDSILRATPQTYSLDNAEA